MPKAHSKKKGNAQRNTAIAIAALLLILLLLLGFPNAKGCGTSTTCTTTSSTSSTSSSTSHSTTSTTSSTTTCFGKACTLSICAGNQNGCYPIEYQVASNFSWFSVSGTYGVIVNFYGQVRVYSGTNLIRSSTSQLSTFNGANPTAVNMTFTNLPSGSYTFNLFTSSDFSGTTITSNIVIVNAVF